MVETKELCSGNTKIYGNDTISGALSTTFLKFVHTYLTTAGGTYLIDIPI